jgi:hypothetical protein
MKNADRKNDSAETGSDRPKPGGGSAITKATQSEI